MFGKRGNDEHYRVNEAISSMKGNFGWPKCSFSEKYGKYVLSMYDDVIARIAIRYSIVNDDYFKEELENAIRKASMEVTIANKGLESVKRACSDARAKYHGEEHEQGS
jgi:hypothetical protein